ncbi:MAG: COX15/CtaA family protein [Solirubrobacterales bacterium]|nr:COX15/CtaA family protein [Solirubrobacterales bacterium]
MRLRDRFEVSPSRFRLVTRLALASLALIVLTGAAVRLTGSGLGCPDWPKCFGGVVAPARTHAVIEYSNRVLSGFVGLVAIAAAIMGWFRKPYRRELEILAVILPLGVVAQAVLGGFTVRSGLEPGYVMAHYILSMLILDAAFALAWCATFEPGARTRATDRLGVWSVRALIPIGATTVMVGTAATAAGPHAGASGTGEIVPRLDIAGHDTLRWMVQRHGVLAVCFGLAVLVVIFILRRPGGERRAQKPLVYVLGLLTLQGIVGISQWFLKLPSQLVWVHVSLAVILWLCVLWAVGSAGLLESEGRSAITE